MHNYGAVDCEVPNAELVDELVDRDAKPDDREEKHGGLATKAVDLEAAHAELEGPLVDQGRQHEDRT